MNGYRPAKNVKRIAELLGIKNLSIRENYIFVNTEEDKMNAGKLVRTLKEKGAFVTYTDLEAGRYVIEAQARTEQEASFKEVDGEHFYQTSYTPW